MLRAVMYHYVRNAEETRYKGIKGESEKAFKGQIELLKARFEMATAESVLAYLIGTYKPKKDLCVLTFDDGLKEHAEFVTETLRKHNIQGQFFIPTRCITEGHVLPVHKNHFLLAYLEFSTYQQLFYTALKQRSPETTTEVDAAAVAKTYRWDTPEVAAFKYLLNYGLPTALRNEVLSIVFSEVFGDEKSFAKELYVSHQALENMQNSGMILGGHSHSHYVLANLSDEEQKTEIETNIKVLKPYLVKQDIVPFTYPFGKKTTFNSQTISLLKKQGVHYAFATEVKDTKPGDDLFSIGRIDPKDILV